MSSNPVSSTDTHAIVRNALWLSTITLMGLTACSTSQVSKSVAEPAVSTVSLPVAVSASEPATDSLSLSASYAEMSSMTKTRIDPLTGVYPMPMVVNDMPPTRDNYQKNEANPVHRTTEMAVSTLSIDTDTGSYANMRRYLNEGRIPPVDAVRVEELINYFNYQFDDGKRLGNAPFVIATEVVDSPWDRADQDNKIVKVGIKAVDNSWSQKTNKQSMPPANLVFLVDVSGSMSSRDKLPLAQSSLKLLTEQMRAEDSISIVTYSGSTSVALPVTSGDQKAKILAAIDGLNAEGSTNGADALKAGL